MADKTENIDKSEKRDYGFNTPQRLFVGYTHAVLVDLTVLNFLRNIGVTLPLTHLQYHLSLLYYCRSY